MTSILPQSQRGKLIAIGLGGVLGLLLLFVFHLLYIQFIMLIWGAVMILGFSIYEKRPSPPSEGGTGSGGSAKRERLAEELSKVEVSLAKSREGGERRSLQKRKEAIELDLMKLRWAARERELEITEKTAVQRPLRALPQRQGMWKKIKQDRRDEAMLLNYLKEAEEVLATEPPDSAPARVGMIASELKAQFRLMGGREVRGKHTGDYANVWALLASVSEGTSPIFAGARTSRKVRSRMEAVVDLAKSRGFIERSVAPDSVRTDQGTWN